MPRTAIEIITELTASGDLMELYRCGLVSATIMQQRDYYFAVHRLVQQGQPIMAAIYETAEQYKVSDTTIKRAWLRFKKQGRE